MSSLWHLNETFPPTPRQENSVLSSLPREPTRLGKGRESPRRFIKAGEVTWPSIFVPVLQLEKLKHRDAGSRTALTPIPAALEPRPEPPRCWRPQLRLPAQGCHQGKHPLPLPIPAMGQNHWPGSLPAQPLLPRAGGGRAGPGETLRKSAGQRVNWLFRKLWENMFMP